MNSRPIYLDYNATTPVDSRVLEAMLPYFTEKFGNPSSAGHAYGWEAKAAVDVCREQIVQSLGGCDPESLIFTSSTTESNNLVIKGIAQVATKAIHIISQKTEHSCILESLKEIERQGHEVTLVDVDEFGKIKIDEFKKAFQKNTALVSVMWANNEIGTIQNISELLKITREHDGVLFHTDAAQAVGKIPINLQETDVDLMSFAAHKMYGPKGVGALYIAKRNPKIRMQAQLHGGGHEFGLRSGTLNVPGIVGFAKALELCLHEMKEESKRQIQMRDQMIETLTSELDHVFLNGHPIERLPNNINLCIEGLNADEIMMALPNLAFSSGAACSFGSSGSTEPSFVIQALGQSKEQAKSSLRISLGRMTTEEEILKATRELINTVQQLRKNSLSYQMLMEQKS